MKKISFKLFLLLLFLFFAFSNHLVLAKNENEIDVEDLSGNNIDGKYIFNESNIYPGWYKVKTVNIKNKSDSKVELYIKFKLKNGEKLAEALNVYAIRKSDNAYKIGGYGDKFTLLTANNQDLFVENLEAGESQKYYIVIEFDKNTGNEYQNLSTRFDASFTIEGKTSKNSSDSDEEILTNQGRIVSDQAVNNISFSSESFLEQDENDNVTQISSDTIENKKDDSKELKSSNENNGIVEGENVCQDNWSFWIWILIVVVFIILYLLIAINIESSEENKRGLFWQLIFLIVALLIWYFFDNCYNYIWVPIIEAICSLSFSVLFYKNNKK